MGKLPSSHPYLSTRCWLGEPLTCASNTTAAIHHLVLHAPEFPPSHTMASPPPVEDQARLLEDALVVVRQQTLLMRRCLETPGKLMDALKCR
jgi:hypothetical protein